MELPCERRLHSTILFVELIGIFNAAVLLCGCLRCWEVHKVKNKHVFDRSRLDLRDKHFYEATSENSEQDYTLLNKIMIFKALKLWEGKSCLCPRKHAFFVPSDSDIINKKSIQMFFRHLPFSASLYWSLSFPYHIYQ